jgi:hypothetical protein
LEFIAYTEEVIMDFFQNQVSHHLFADDKQIYHACLIEQINSVRKVLGDCILDIRDCCSSRRLQLNALKTELAWFGSRANLQKLASTDLSMTVGGDVIEPVSTVRDLGCLP